MSKTGVRLVGAVAFVLAAGSANAAEKVVWNYAVYGPSRAVTKQIEYVAEYVAEKSGGNFEIKIGFAESIAPAKETLDSIRIGAVEGGMVAFGYAPGKAPLHLALDLPYLPIPDIDVLQKVMEDFNRWEPIEKELDNWNGHWLYGVLLPLYEIMGTGDAPTTLEGWKGMRVRALGPGGDAMRALGAVPTSVPAPEVYTALERGTFQAASFPFSYSFGAYRLHEVSSWYTYGLQFGIIHNALLASDQAYEALPEEYKQLLEDAREGQYEASKAAYREADEKFIPIFDQTLQRVTITPEQQKEYQEIAGRPVWNRWIEETSAKGLPAQEAIDLIIASAEKHSQAR